jgi:hypothetical protein
LKLFIELVEPTVLVELAEELTLETAEVLAPELEFVELTAIKVDPETAETEGALAAIACWAAWLVSDDVMLATVVSVVLRSR